MTEDDGPDYWQAMQEQERQEQEAADALESYELSGAQRENKRQHDQIRAGLPGCATGNNVRIEGCDESPF